MALELRMIKSNEWAGLDASAQRCLSPPPTAPCCIWLTNPPQGDFLQIRSKTHPLWFQTPVAFPPQCIPVEVSPGRSSQAVLGAQPELLPAWCPCASSPPQGIRAGIRQRQLDPHLGVLPHHSHGLQHHPGHLSHCGLQAACQSRAW